MISACGQGGHRNGCRCRKGVAGRADCNTGDAREAPPLRVLAPRYAALEAIGAAPVRGRAPCESNGRGAHQLRLNGRRLQRLSQGSARCGYARRWGDPRRGHIR
jgi:hypothetical protein